ncbi:MAG: hypothetical protein AAF936_10450 [Pseudomonadota bacterium]
MERETTVGKTQKKSPSTAIDGLHENFDADLTSITSNSVDSALYGLLQCRRIVSDVKELAKRFTRRQIDSIEIAKRQTCLKRTLNDGAIIYSRCFPTDVRESFGDLVGVSFEDFEVALLYISDELGTPLHWWGRHHNE